MRDRHREDGLEKPKSTGKLGEFGNNDIEREGLVLYREDNS